jgi:hypothetical protein
LLAKGLQFVPTPTQYSNFDSLDLFRDALQLVRRVRLKHFFRDKEDNRGPPNPFISSSGWTPPVGLNRHLERFVNCVTQDAIDFAPPASRSNLSKEQRNAIASLTSNREIVIKPADKGGAIVIWGAQDYRQEALRQLTNRRHYEVLQSDPTARYTKEVKSFIRFCSRSNHIPDKEAKYLMAYQPKLATFYMLPKIHKTGNPGRPIVSACDCPTERISAYVDHHLRPLVEQSASYIRDSTHFLNKLQEVDIPANAIMCTADVSSLYTNIPHTDGLYACKQAQIGRAHV